MGLPLSIDGEHALEGGVGAGQLLLVLGVIIGHVIVRHRQRPHRCEWCAREVGDNLLNGRHGAWHEQVPARGRGVVEAAGVRLGGGRREEGRQTSKLGLRHGAMLARGHHGCPAVRPLQWSRTAERARPAQQSGPAHQALLQVLGPALGHSPLRSRSVLNMAIQGGDPKTLLTLQNRTPMRACCGLNARPNEGGYIATSESSRDALQRMNDWQQHPYSASSPNAM